MIEFNRKFSEAPADSLKIKVIGIGGAGCNSLDRMVLDGIENADLVAINCDVQALTGSVASEKIQLGRGSTRGLGAGGDPEMGAAAAEESLDELRQIFEGVSMVFLCTGLGGGTGSGASPVIASLAKEHGALVVAFATLPFGFEGKRRRLQAEDALIALQETADAVICFENDKMGEAVSAKAGIHHAFANADQTISQSVRAICDLFKHPGLLHIGFDDLAAALRNRDSRCVFGFGEAEGDNRAHESLARALKNPLMDRGRMLLEANSILVNVAGGPNLTLNEVQILMEELNRHINDHTQILFGTTVDPQLGDTMSVTIISSIAGSEEKAAVPDVPARRPLEEAPDEPVAATEVAEKEEPEEVKPPVSSEQRPEPIAAERRPVVKREAEPEPDAAAAKQPQQETLQFEPVTRGRFEKSEPTIVDGQDLDVPTFLRRNVRVK
jgi:cell division protein FtsZ